MTPEESRLRDALILATEPPPGLADRALMRVAVRTPGRRAAPTWLAGAVATVLAIAMIATFLAIATGNRGHGERGATASAPRTLTSGAPWSSTFASPCQTPLVMVRLVAVWSLMMQPRAEFEFTNRGPDACLMSGWPEVQLVDASGAVLPSRQVTHLYIGGEEKPVAVRLPMGGHAYVGLGWATGAAPPCVSSGRFLITPPGAGQPMEVRVVMGADGSFPVVCPPDSLAVLPVQPAPPAGMDVSAPWPPAPLPSVSPPAVVTGDQAGSFCLTSGGGSFRVDFSGASPPQMHVVTRGLPASSDVRVEWGNPYAGGAYFIGHFATDGAGNADVWPSTDPLVTYGARTVYVSYYPPGSGPNNAKPTPLGQAQAC